MEPIELTISDGEETYVLSARSTDDGWLADLFDESAGVRTPTYPPCFHQVAHDFYATPLACLEAMFKAVTTDLFGIRA